MVWVQEALNHYIAGHYEETLAAREQALRLNYTYPRAHHEKSLALIGLRRYEEAVTSLDRSIGLSRRNKIIRDYIAKMYIDKGRALRALKCYEASLQAYQRAENLAPIDEKLRVEKDKVLFHLADVRAEEEVKEVRMRPTEEKARETNHWLCEEPFRYE